MSTAAEDEGEGEGRAAPVRRLVLRIAAGLAAIVSIIALWSGESARVADDLQLFAEPAARPGETLALRALLLRDVESVEGPTLATAAVKVRLLDVQERELASTSLRATALDSMEGFLRVPDVAHGKLRLEATVDDGKRDTHARLMVQRTLQVRATIEPRTATSRSAGALQHFAVGRVHALNGALPPSQLEPRVIAGSCVPEQRCTLLVWVGEPAASIQVQPAPAFTQLGPVEPSTETSGLVAITLQVHGAEADVTLRALRANKEVAERAIRLPVALGEAVIAIKHSPLLPSLTALALTLTAPPGRDHLIVDTFVAGRWSQTKTAANVAKSALVYLDPIAHAAGIVRLQARSDRYSAEGSGTRVVYVQAAGESAEHSLAAIARSAREAGLADAASERFERSWQPLSHHDTASWAAYLLAPFELSRMTVPLAASGRPARLARLAGVRTFLRFGLGGVLVCCAIVVGASLLRSGFAASEQAGSIMDEARESAHAQPSSRYASRLWVLVWVALVCMAFLAAALLVVAKPLWF